MSLLQDVDARAKLAGTNKLELLLFTLGEDAHTGRREVFGINVFKVREVMTAPPITRAPQMPDSVVGMLSLRGQLVPVVDLANYAKVEVTEPPRILVVTEYNNRTQGFLVEAVDTILRLDWADIKAPPDMFAAHQGGLVTAVTRKPDGTLVMLMDVEKVLAETANIGGDTELASITPAPDAADAFVFFVDDSTIARTQVQRTLDAMGIRHQQASNGREAWEKLQEIASKATVQGVKTSEILQLVLTDVEMPEMDGYILTKNIKGDPRFAGIPVIMHTSLSGDSNHQLGTSVGVDAYVAKFEPGRLAETIKKYLKQGD